MRAVLLTADSHRLDEMLSFIVGGFPPPFVGLGPRVERAMREIVGHVRDVCYRGGAGSVRVSRRFVSFNGEPCLVVAVCDWGASRDPFRGDGLADHVSYRSEGGSNMSEMYFLAPRRIPGKGPGLAPPLPRRWNPN
jgi:hypothetical protein